MKTNNQIIINTLYGILFVGIFAFFSILISKLEFFEKLGIIKME